MRRGALWSLATSVLLRVASVLSTAIVAHILNRLDFGVFAIAMTVNGVVLAIGELGMGSCLVRADLDIESLAPTMVTVSIVTNTLQAAAMTIFAAPIAAALGSVRAADSIKILAIGMFIGSVFSVPNCQLVRDFKQNRLFQAQAVAFALSTFVLFVLAKSGSGATSFAWSMLTSQIAYGCVVIFSVPKFYRPSFTRNALSILLRSGLPLGAANIVNYILLNVDFGLLGHLMGAVALGTYVLAFNVASWPASLLGNMINNVSMPAFSRIKHDADLLRSALSRALRSLSLVVLPISALTMVLARPIILALYGAKWAAAGEVLSILTIYGAISIVCVLFANVLAGLGLSRFLLAVQMIWLGALVPAMVIGIHKGGIAGAAVAHIVVIGPGVLPCYLFVLKRTTGIRLLSLARAILPALLASSVAALAAFAAVAQLTDPLAQLAAGLAVGGLIYATLTTPQALELLSRGHDKNPYLNRIIRAYRVAAQIAGVRSVSRARHAAERGTQLPRAHLPERSSRVVAEPGRPRSARPAARGAAGPQPDVMRSTELALQLLISLSTAEPPLSPLAKEASQVRRLPVSDAAHG